MHIKRVCFIFALVVSQCAILPDVYAAPLGGVVISQIQVGDKSSSRLIELYNNNNQPVDITDWCARYVSAGSTLSHDAKSARACFTTASPAERLLLRAQSYLLVGSAQLGLEADFVMTEGLGSGPSGKIYLTDAHNNVIDIFGWGGSETKSAEGTPKPADSTTKVYERRLASSGLYVDTDNNSLDFVNSVQRDVYQTGSIDEVIDVCLNVSDIQVLVPSGMVLSGNEQCVVEPVDLCDNIEGLQSVLPADTEVDDNGHCYVDACTNLPGIHETIPAGFEAGENGTCSLNILPIEVTELLPNPDGDDSSNEFIELYNPNDRAVDTTYHLFHLNGDYNKTYGFPAGLIIEPHSYRTLYNRDVAFTLTNSSGSLRLRTLDNIHIFDVPDYSDAESGQAWALIGGVWQYTTIPTPGAENEAAPAGNESMAAMKEMADCGEGRERNPATNRCRSISTATSSLAACNIDQYRNPDTGRCRKITTASLVPCKDGQYRSEETNRCRNIITTANAKPCKDSQYRSEETGRCRNLPASSVPNAGFAVQPVQEAGKAFVGWWALGGVSLLAAGYAGWEWRRELAALWNSTVNRFR